MKIKRLPRTHAQLCCLLEQAHSEGYRLGQKFESELLANREKKLLQDQKFIRLEALKAVTSLASAQGQFAGEIARAMASEAGQL